MKRDGFAQRYVIKIISSVIITVINAVIQLILPIALTIADYGYYSYNLNVFTSVVTIATLSAPNALTTKFAMRNGEIGLVKFYLKFFLLVCIVLNIAVSILCAVGDTFFAGQTMIVVLMGLNVAILNNMQTQAIGLFNSLAISRFPEAVHIVEKIVSCIIIAGIYAVGIFRLEVFYVCQIAVVFVTVIVLMTAIFKDNRRMYPNACNKTDREYLKEYITFCKPLAVPAIISPFITVLKNSVLMSTAGEEAQAMYGIGIQFNTVVSYAFSPYAELMRREYAILKDDFENRRHRFLQSMRQMFWLSGYFSIYILVCADWIIRMLFGDKYMGAVLVTRLMMGYTIYQAIGQLSGSYLIGIAKVRAQAYLSYASMILSLVGIFIFQMPNGLFPNGLGETGIGLSYMIVNFISTWICMVYCMKSLKVKIRVYVDMQMTCFIICGISAIASRLLADIFFVAVSTHWALTAKVLFSGITYTGLVALFIWKRPDTVGVTKDRLTGAARKALGIIKRRKIK